MRRSSLALRRALALWRCRGPAGVHFSEDADVGIQAFWHKGIPFSIFSQRILNTKKKTSIYRHQAYLSLMCFGNPGVSLAENVLLLFSFIFSIFMRLLIGPMREKTWAAMTGIISFFLRSAHCRVRPSPDYILVSQFSFRPAISRPHKH